MAKLFLSFFMCLAYAQASNHGGSKEAYFWQLTDVHYDPWYLQYGVGSCNYDIGTYPTYGSYECDSPWRLVNSAINAMKKLDGDKEPDFIALTGGYAPHPKQHDVLTFASVTQIVQNVTNKLKEVYPDTTVLPILGNKDIYWGDYMTQEETDKIYNTYADMWKAWLPGNAETTFRKAGYYTRPLEEGHSHVEGLVMNNVLHYEINTQTTGQYDPGDHFMWLEQTLKSMRRNGTKTFLFSHVPLGKFEDSEKGKVGLSYWIRSHQNYRIYDIVAEFSDVIIAYISGHGGQDTFKLFYSRQNEPVNVMYVCPSLTPRRNQFSYTDPSVNGPAHNPGFRKFKYSTETYEITEMEQYYLDLDEANDMNSATWELAYKFTDLYDLDDMKPATLHGLYEDMKDEDSSEFESYMQMNTVNTDHPSITSCNCLCKSVHLCGMRHIKYDRFDACFARQDYCPKEEYYNVANTSGVKTWLTLALSLACVALVLLRDQ